MKTRIIIALVFLVTLSLTMHGQIKLNPILGKEKLNLNKTKIDKKCVPLNIRDTEYILRERIGRTLKISMDRDYGYIEVMGNRQNISFNEYKVEKAGHDWKYYLNNVNSEVVRVEYSRKKFILTVAFEKEGPEVKGKCPGCKVGKDNRAPDINWQDPKIKIELIPTAYNNSFTFQVSRVKFLGKFKLNGPLQKFFPAITTYFKAAIVNEVKMQIANILNRNSIKNMFADAFRNEVRELGLNSVKSIDMSKENIYLCNYYFNERAKNER